jgi:hypothetical protein
VELGKEVDPDELAIIVFGSRENVGDKMVAVNEPAITKNVLDVKY